VVDEQRRSGNDETEDDFGAAVATEVPGLYRYALMLVGERAEAEDLVDDTVVRALERRMEFRGESALRTWLHRILHHLAVDHARHHRYEVLAEDIEALWRSDAFSVDSAVVVERAETQAEMRDALVHLPYGHRSVVVLHDAEGFPTAEIATMLGIGLPAAKQRLRRGRMMLVTALAGSRQRQVDNRSVPLSCFDARRQVSDYLDDELADDRRTALEVHLARCTTCPPLYQALVGVRASLGRWRDPDSVVPPRLARRIQLLTSTNGGA